ncbi:hypothetical protein CON48_19805 [Bacillus thuringiensis]|uniref:hypothetical protein n=1 Tax=Bacillus cereus group TaxID=86661 RepID=UPI000BEBF870|nr:MULTISPECIES: hypothetical protein [Bacillus cereus group]PEA48707.1 hypothetical protein CON48_19805 [Bacillus thuringiensis]PES89571.1 hypothetical protein CN511_02460 [Bacillus thuringiensis]PEZ71056.1 hypothetical protein CN371_16595 [Bacillus thuringiensis]PFE05047.1 hypothetical protein CN303_28550 [Bacillus thuringiensis]PFT59030.1 hypothetical protein COK82_13760 [Bacillus thuringiensis]
MEDYIKVQLVYPTELSINTKELELNKLELDVLLNSKKVGSEGYYYKINEIIFEDIDGVYSATVILK